MSCSKNKFVAPSSGEEVVITGIAGKFPDSEDVEHFRDNLYNKVDLVSDDDRRWKAGTHQDIPHRTGKLFNLNKFDAGFFGIHQHQVQTLDPMCRLLLERSFEAIVDAGLNPKELQGSSTGVFVGACFSETEKISFYELKRQCYGIIGATRSMLAQRINYFFRFNGPSCICDTACSSSLFALEHAYRAIREGSCDNALVGGCNLCLHPIVSQQFARLGVLSPDGACKSFDDSANGYARSEGIVVILLQRAKEARRVYAEIIHSKTNCDGYKEQGITYPSGNVQKVLLDEFYEECGVPPNSLTYVEAHGTGTKVGDPEELGTLDEVFCTGRDRPLLIGSVKSNIGHNEPVSGLCSIVKVIIGIENGFIPPNIHFKEPRKGIEALEKGRMKVVSEKTPLPDNAGLFGINSFGFGGANSHLLLKWNTKVKETLLEPMDPLPRLVCLNGRNAKFLECMFEVLGKKWMDFEYIALLHEIYKYEIQGNYCRGFAIVGKNIFWTSTNEFLEEVPPPITLVFNGLDSKWSSCIRNLQSIPLFAAHLQRLQEIAESNDLPINISSLVNNYREANLLHAIVGSIVVQTGLADLLTVLNLPVIAIHGVNLGELSAAYAKGKLTLEQTLLAAYYIGTTDPKLAVSSVLEHFYKIMPSAEAVYLSTAIFQTKTVKTENGNTLIIGRAQKPSQKCFTLIGHTVVDLLTSLGRLYELGFNFNLANIYPAIQFPVSRGTPMISPLIRWDHDKDWFVTIFNVEDKKSCCQIAEISLKDEAWSFVRGHVIDGRNLFPATGYLYIVWETLGTITGKLVNNMKVVFENVKFVRAAVVPAKSKLVLKVMILKGGGYFEVLEGDNQVVVTGTIYEVQNTEEEFCELPAPDHKENVPVLTGKDIYKELKLRGYNYKEEFKAIKEFHLENNYGKVSWTGNWVSFMDNLLQLQILQGDTRNLYVPTRIERLVVDPEKHLQFVETHSNLCPAYVYKHLNLLKSGGVEIRGLNASSITRRKQAEPVLDVYKFVPNNSNFSLQDSIRILVQLALENHSTINVKTVEIQNGSHEILSPLINNSLADLPLIQAETFIHLEEPMDVPAGITIDERKFGAVTDCYFVIAPGILTNTQLRVSVLNVLKPTGFVISRENLGFVNSCNELTILATHTTPNEILVLAKKNSPVVSPTIICIDSSFDWLAELQKTDSEVLLYSQDNPESGILGLVNCLRREPNGERIKCVFILHQAPSFDVTNNFYKMQLDKGLAVNIYKDGEWGTYRHLLLGDSLRVMSEHSYVNVTTSGDLSSLSWIQSGLTSQSVMEPGKVLVNIYCSALNFRDVMTASGRIQSDVVTSDRLQQECVQGFEFTGRDLNGRRVMGMVISNALATIIAADSQLLWTIPDNWTMEEAATIPVVYGTVLFGLMVRARLKRGQSILIHSGTGGVGQAAINVCLHYDCNIFVTVGTEEKKDFIRKNFPKIKASQIGCSRNCSFEQMIYRETSGRGVDIVLNSLADEKLQASIRCLAEGGHFVEIGKFDLANDSQLQLAIANKNCHFHGLMLDSFIKNSHKDKTLLNKLIRDGVESGAVKPLPKTCFARAEIEQAFRLMATGKHMGKVLIKVKPEEPNHQMIAKNEKFDCIPRYWCDSGSTYIVIGGLGGFGLELVDWLILRGSRKIVLNSRRGLTTGYQALRIRIWKTYGVVIHISNHNINTYEGVQALLKEAESLGPVKAIFNLAVDLCDALLENQTVESFKKSAGPKAVATQHLDLASREICPKLESFVVFSSVSCGRGNAGQTNYGWSNSVMERICERRKACNLPALAIQWGAIGDVGLVAEMQEQNNDVVIGGTLQQRISSCLEVLDKLLKQEETIVSSIVVAEKRSSAAGADNIVDAVVYILGLRDLKTVSLHSSLPELGMDSMMAVEIKQTLEREYEVFLTPQDIRSMTFARLKEIAAEKTSEKLSPEEELPRDVNLLLRFIADENDKRLSVVLPSLSSGPKTVFLMPGIEGTALVFEPLVKNIKAKTVSIQYCYENDDDGIPEIARQILPILEEQLAPDESFTIIGYSYGTAIALELTHILEKTRKGTLILIDGAPTFMKLLIDNQLETATDAELQISLLCHLMSFHLPHQLIAQCKVALVACANFEERIKLCLSLAPTKLQHSHDYIKKVCIAAYNRIQATYAYTPTINYLQSEVVLLRPKNSSVSEIEDDYKLASVVGKTVNVKFFDGDHVSILENLSVAEEINRIMGLASGGKRLENVIPLSIPIEVSQEYKKI